MYDGAGADINYHAHGNLLMAETAEHKAAIKWFRERYPEHRQSIRASLSGLNLGSGSKAARMMNHIKSLGMELGESDLLIALPKGGYGSLVLEHKGEGQSHKLSDKQADYLGYHNMIGNRAVSTRGLAELQREIEDYMGM